MKSKASKPKSDLSKITVSPEKSYFVISAGIKVYPVSNRGHWFIEIDNNGILKRYDKVVKTGDISGAIASTILDLYKKLQSKALKTKNNTK